MPAILSNPLPQGVYLKKDGSNADTTLDISNNAFISGTITAKGAGAGLGFEQLTLTETGASSTLKIEKLNAGGATYSTSDGTSHAFSQSIGVAGDIGGTGDITRTGEMVLTTATDYQQATSDHQYTITRYSADTGSAIFNGKKGRGTLASPDYPNSGDFIARFWARPWNDGSFPATGRINMVADINHSLGIADTRIDFYTTPAYTATLMATFDADGEVYFPAVYNDTVGGTNRDLYIDDTGKLGYVSSSLKYKENIVDTNKTAWIYGLRVVDFDYKDSNQGLDQTGLIAEEVAEIEPRIVSYRSNLVYKEIVDEEGEKSRIIDRIETTNEPEAVNYSSPILISALVKEIQNLKARVEALE